MSTATVWAELQDAMTITPPHCLGDERFTAETREHDAALAEVCAECPVLDLCARYARTANITQTYGYYGGVIRRGSHRQRGSRLRT